MDCIKFLLIFSMEFAKQPADVRKLQQEIKKREWDVNLVDSSQGADSEVAVFKGFKRRVAQVLYSPFYLFLARCNHCWGSVTFVCAPDPNPFFSDFKDAKNYLFFSYFFLKLTRRHIILIFKF
jgi:hypothetical protein